MNELLYFGDVNIQDILCFFEKHYDAYSTIPIIMYGCTIVCLSSVVCYNVGLTTRFTRALFCFKKEKKKYPFSVFKNRGVTEGLLKPRRGLMG
jgi:hypothetical protein